MIKEIASKIIQFKENIVLIYAFNGTGKTRLSVSYKDETKQLNDGCHSGVYYNAYSEDLFNWNNDEENNGDDVRLLIGKSSLNQYHSLIDETNLREHLASYKPRFDFKFKFYDNTIDGIESVRFYPSADITVENSEDNVKKISDDKPIKISRGEEQIFIWSFFLALFDVQDWTGEGKQSSHFFIDDPVSSLDDHNIFVTVASIMNLIEKHYKNRKIIVTTHHIGFFSILHDWLSKGEKASSYKGNIKTQILKRDKEIVKFINPKNDVFLYHLELLQTIKKSINEDNIYAYHFALLRQVLENIASFLGVGRFAYVLEQIGIEDVDEIARIVNTMSHKTVFRYEAKELVPDNKELFVKIFDLIQQKYKFVLHT